MDSWWALDVDGWVLGGAGKMGSQVIVGALEWMALEWPSGWWCRAGERAAGGELWPAGTTFELA